MTIIKHKRGSGVPPVAELEVGELAIDTIAAKLYTKIGNVVVEIGGGGSTKDASQNIDGGNASSIYLLDQVINGGSA